MRQSHFKTWKIMVTLFIIIILYFFKHNICIKPCVLRQPWRNPSNRRLYKHGICIHPMLFEFATCSAHWFLYATVIKLDFQNYFFVEIILFFLIWMLINLTLLLDEFLDKPLLLPSDGHKSKVKVKSSIWYPASIRLLEGWFWCGFTPQFI